MSKKANLAPPNDSSRPRVLTELKKDLCKRANRHNRVAKFYLGLTVLVTLFCATVFVCADRITDFLSLMVATPEQRLASQKLIDAEVKMKTAFADLADPAAEGLTSVANNFLKMFEEASAQLVKRDAEESAIDYAIKVNTINAKMNYERALHQYEAFVANPEPPAAPAERVVFRDTQYVEGLHEDLRAARNDANVFRTQAIDAEQNSQQLRKSLAAADDTAISLRDQIENLQDEKVELQSNLIQQQAAINSSMAWTGFFSSNIARIGSLVLLIWLARIFLSGYRFSTRMSCHYWALADAVAVVIAGSDRDYKSIVDALSAPAAVDSIEPVRSPVPEVSHLLKALAGTPLQD